MVRTDPTGMWSLGSLWGDLTHGIHQFGHAMGVNWDHGLRTDVELLGAAALGFGAGGLVMDGMLAGIEVPTIGDVAYAGLAGLGTAGAVGGAGAGYIQGGNLASAARGAIYGGSLAISGAFCAAQGFGLIGTVLAQGTVGGGLSSAMGEGFVYGFNGEPLLSLQGGIFSAFVGTSATTASGTTMPTDQNYYAFSSDGKVPSDWWDMNVIGLNELNSASWFAQGGPLSRFLSLIPGMNSVALFHDRIFAPGALPFNIFTNVPAMIPEAGITYGAIINGVGGELH